MWPYWVMFFIPAMFAIYKPGFVTYQSRDFDKEQWIIFICLALLIGFRFQVGGDWGNYLRRFNDNLGLSFFEVMQLGDPFYHLFNWISQIFDWGMIGTNVLCGVIFSFCLVKFCFAMPRPWLALLVSIPNIVIVMGMGYTRQGVALSLVMLALLSLTKGNVLKFLFWTLIAAAFHKSAVLMMPLAGFINTRYRLVALISAVVMAYLSYSVFLDKSVDDLVKNYIDAEYESQGAFVRLLMNVLPAVIFIVWRKRFMMNKSTLSLWSFMALMSILLMAILFVSPSSTAVDRVALFMLPLQVAVFSYLPDIFGPRKRKILTAATVFYYFIVLFVWLNFANFSIYWLPYQFYPFLYL